MKILFVSPSFHPATYYGGPIYSVFNLAKGLMKQQVDIKVVTTNANGKEKVKLKPGIFHLLENELHVKYYSALNSKGASLSMALNLWKDIKETDLVYLVSVFSPPTPLSIIFCRLFSKPLIISPHGQLGEWSLKSGSRFKKLWLKVFIKPIINKLYWHLTSFEEKRDILELFPSAQTFVVPNGINLGDFPNQNKLKDRSFFNKYAKTECKEKRIIVSMGRLHKIKGFDILIDAFDNLIKQNHDLLLLIAGEDFGQKKELEKLINEKKLTNRIYFIGHIAGEEKVNFLSNADVFALSSYYENFGMVYAEAFAAGTPIVASKNTPWEEVEKYNCGKWVDNTPRKFAEAIKEILSSNYEEMGRRGARYVEENFDCDKIASSFKDQIERIILKNITNV